QALVWAGEADPCEGRKDIEANSNPDYERLAVLLHAWHTCYGPHDIKTLKEVLADIDRNAQHLGPESTSNQWNDPQDALGAYDPRYDGKTLNSGVIGYALRAWQGRIIDGMRLVKAGELRRATKWRVEILG